MGEDAFSFLRATLYRWAQQWHEVCHEVAGAPRVLAIGDLHTNSFGTWRDAEGRLAWGVDDFDEAYPLPYTSDLLRPARSARIAIDGGQLSLSPVSITQEHKTRWTGMSGRVSVSRIFAVVTLLCFGLSLSPISLAEQPRSFCGPPLTLSV